MLPQRRARACCTRHLSPHEASTQGEGDVLWEDNWLNTSGAGDFRGSRVVKHHASSAAAQLYHHTLWLQLLSNHSSCDELSNQPTAPRWKGDSAACHQFMSLGCKTSAGLMQYQCEDMMAEKLSAGEQTLSQCTVSVHAHILVAQSVTDNLPAAI